MAAKQVRNSVKPLTHWAVYKGYRMRYTARSTDEVRGVLTTPDGPIAFAYDPVARTIRLPDASITINEYGWEVGRDDRAGSQPIE